MSGWRAALGAFLACMAAITGPAAAQAVYRCGNEYRAAPCPGGAAVDVKDERTEAQRGKAVEAARTDARTASQLERDRQAREAATSGPPIGGFYTLPRAASQPAAAPAKGKAASRKKKPRAPSARTRA